MPLKNLSTNILNTGSDLTHCACYDLFRIKELAKIKCWFKIIVCILQSHFMHTWRASVARTLNTILNKRPMGHIAHLRKQFQSINTHDYIITLIKRRKKNIIKLMSINWFFIWRNLNPYHPRMLVPGLVEIGTVVLEKRIF